MAILGCIKYLSDGWAYNFFPGKKQTDDLFDLLDTTKLNAHLKELMPGLTAKVFRTYNASITLDEKVSCKLGPMAAYQQFNMSHSKVCEFILSWIYVWSVDSCMRKPKMVMSQKKLLSINKQTSR